MRPRAFRPFNDVTDRCYLPGVPARTGLGVPQAKRFRTYFSSSSTDPAGHADTSTAGDPLPDLQGYLARVKSSMDERRAYGLLQSLRRTCEELDRRAGIEDSPMWRDPDEEAREQQRVRNRKMFDRLDTELDSDDERKTVADPDRGERKKAGRGDLAYEVGTSRTVVETEDDESARAGEPTQPVEDADEEAEWFSYDASRATAFLSRGPGSVLTALSSAQIRSRLALTLTYLRNKYQCVTLLFGLWQRPTNSSKAEPYPCAATASGVGNSITMQRTSNSTVRGQKRRSTSAWAPRWSLWKIPVVVTFSTRPPALHTSDHPARSTRVRWYQNFTQEDRKAPRSRDEVATLSP